MATPNPQPIDIPVIGPSKNVAQDDPELTLNMYGEQVSDEVYTLKPRPGFELDSIVGEIGACRGQITVQGRYFVVVGSLFLEKVGSTFTNVFTNPPALPPASVPCTPVASYDATATLLSSSGQVGMIANNPPGIAAQVMVVDGSKGYVFALGANAGEGGWINSTVMAARGFVGGNSQIAFCAGRAIAPKPGTAQWQFSALYDFSNFCSSTDAGFATCLSLLDGEIKAVVSNGDLAYFLGSKGFEVWKNVGTSPNPLQRVLAFDKIGIIAPFSAFFFERYVYWLGGTIEGQGVVYRHSGGGPPERISDHPVERNIAALANQGDARASVMYTIGHIFYLLTFQTGNRTFVYDAQTGLWHEQAQRTASNQQICMPFVSIIIYNDVYLGIDFYSDRIWKISNDIFTDNLLPIPRERKLFPIPKEGDYLSFYQSAELFCEVGNTPVGQPEPVVSMRYSFDRGKTWSNEETRPIGGNGSYAVPVKFTGMGAGYSISLWFSIAASQYISWRMVRLRAQ